MTNPLPQDGRERAIFLVALARMSSQCQPPNLLAECPFSIEIADGERGCGEECESLLGIHGPAERPGQVALSGTEMAAAPRPKQSRAESRHHRAFDATEIYYRESERDDISTWSPVSLLVGLSRAVGAAPEARTEAQGVEAAVCLAELERRGFDTEAILHGPLASKLARNLAVEVLVAGLQPENGLRPARVIALLDARDALLRKVAVQFRTDLPAVEVNDERLDRESAERVLLTVAGLFFETLLAWARSAPFGELLSWAPIGSAFWSETEQAPQTSGEAEWIVERFTKTYLSDWSPDSLRREWASHRGVAETSLSIDVLRQRRIDPLELAERIADLPSDDDANRNVRDLRLTHSALSLLDAGQRVAAAALFDAARQSDWSDARLHNNYGFCVLPDDAEEALRALDLSRSMGFTGTVNRANRALALFRSGRTAASLEVLESSFEVWKDLDRDHSWLWEFDTMDDAPVIVEICPRCYLVRLGAFIADTTEDGALRATWHRRLANLAHVDD